MSLRSKAGAAIPAFILLSLSCAVEGLNSTDNEVSVKLTVLQILKFSRISACFSLPPCPISILCIVNPNM